VPSQASTVNSSWTTDFDVAEGNANIAVRPGAAYSVQDVVEKDRDVDGHHQALFRLPRYWREFAADGPVWRKTFYWYVVLL
jgi:hypothetical protein